jgi:cell division protein FtsQ
MTENKRYYFKKILGITIWILVGAGMSMLLVAAISKKNNDLVSRVFIQITGVQNNYFIDKEDVVHILEGVYRNKLEGAKLNSLDLTLMEETLEKDKWIRNAELFFDNNNVLQVNISEKEPIARIISTTGNSFYLGDQLERLPLSDKFSARLPVFTNFPSDVMVLSKSDSALLLEIKILSEYIGAHPFWMAQIDQVDITPSNTFELVPKLGNQVIRFGSVDFYQEKFNNLLAFYKKVQTRVSWNRYSIVDIQFRNQVVGVKRDALEIKGDSLKAIQIMKNIIADAEKKSVNDSTIQLEQNDNPKININESRVIDEVPDEGGVNSSEEKSITNSTLPKTPQKVSVDKNEVLQLKEKEMVKDTVVKRREIDTKKKPKSIMPLKKNITH